MNTTLLTCFTAAVCAVTFNSAVQGQDVPARSASRPAQSDAPLTVTLRDALDRAQMNAPQLLSSVNEARQAREDVLQARAVQRPSVSFKSDYLGTQGNGVLPSGRFVTNDGVHLYREWGVVHQDFTAALTRTGPQRAQAAEALALARAEIARRGLTVTVTKAYYGLLAGQRRYATAQQALDQAKGYLDITQKLESGGEVPHSDTIRADLQYSQQEQAFAEAKLAMDTARLDLAVLLFRDFNQNFTVVDDLTLAAALPPFADIQTMAERENPDLRAANAALRAASLDVKIARQAFLPTLTADVVYGIEANAFALHSTVAAAPEAGPLPNLGYFATISLNLPLWDWGARTSKVRQAKLRREQADVELTAAQRTLIRNLQGYYQEAQTSRDQLERLRRSVDQASENLRLNGLRYQAGEATILELVDAQALLTGARNAYDDGLVRYRVALANLQTVTGTF